jgi:hypothetical protein
MLAVYIGLGHKGTPWSLPIFIMPLVRVVAASWNFGTQLKATEPAHQWIFSGAKTAVTFT